MSTLALLSLLATTQATAAPITLSHSGRILDTTGAPVEGTSAVVIQLHDDATSGNQVWTSTVSNTPVNDGYYAMDLSGGTPTLDSDLFGSAPLYMQVLIDGVAVGGRQPLRTVPNAVHAVSVGGGDIVLPTANAGSCTTDGALARDAGTGALRVCSSGTYVEIASASQVDTLIANSQGTAPATLGARVGHAATRARAYAEDISRDWQPVSGIIIPFTSRGGPIQVTTSIAMQGGSTTGCRSVIDGIPASLYTDLDSTYYWVEGLELTNDGWGMWNTSMLYEGVADGKHVLTIECHNDSTSDTELGNGRMTNLASVIAYDPVDTAEVKATSGEVLADVDVGTAWTNISGLSVPFTAQGGPVRISWAVPMNGGSHSACRPLIDGVRAGIAEGDNDYRWSEGLVKTNDGWGMHNRTRIYGNVAPGPHTLTMECSTDSSTVNVGNSRMGPVMSATTYPASSSAQTVVFDNFVGRLQGNMSNWTTITELSTSLTTLGGPVEIGVSLPLNGGSTATCRPTLDGAPIPSDVDDFTYIWHDGLARSNDGWAMWDRVRVYDDIAPGTYNLGVQCRTDNTTTLNVGVGGGPSGTNQVWAVAYAP